MLIIGIDPGTHGALCVFETDTKEVIEVFDFNKVSYPEIRMHLMIDKRFDGIRKAFMEKPRPPAKENSVQSARKFGEEIGYIKGLMVGMGIALELIADKQWQTGMVKPLLQGPARKRALQAVCLERFPELGKLVTLNTCDAILIAEYASKHLL